VKLVIFGATGGTGRQLLEQALAQGHIVTAFARDPAKVATKHENLSIVQGDMLRSESVEKAVANQDAVLSALGVRPPVLTFVAITIACQLIHRVVSLPRAANLAIEIGVPLIALFYLFRRNSALSDGTRNIVQAMEKHGVRRFVCESSLGVAESKWRLGFLYNAIVVSLFLRNMFADKALQEHIIHESTLEWVIVRPTALTNGPRKGMYRTGAGVGHWFWPTTISRADVADFMLRQVAESTHLRKSPGIAY
jgi:putative NADH-flavin reductase